MTLLQQYYKLENDIYNEYERLINIGDYDFIEPTIKEYFDEVANENIEMIREKGINEAEQNYDILGCFTQICYIDRRGNERMAYLLGAEKENGLYVFDNNNFDEMFISFSDLNGLLSKIHVIEEIQNS